MMKLEFVLNLNAFLALLISTHPKHRAVKEKVSTATKIIIPDILIIELQWVVLSKRYPEINQDIFAQTMEAIKTDPLIELQAVTPEIANEQKKWYDKLSFFDAYYAAFSAINKKKLLTTDPDFKPYDFALVL
jgi:predicted nucleic acid-binding protein